MSRQKCHAFPAILSVVIACSKRLEVGGNGGLVSQLAKEFSYAGSQVLLDGRAGHNDSWEAGLLDEDASDDGSLRLRAGFSYDGEPAPNGDEVPEDEDEDLWDESRPEVDVDEDEYSTFNPLGGTIEPQSWSDWFGSSWDPILGEEELLNMQDLLAVDGGGTMTKVIYGPCKHRRILNLCCGFVPREKFLDKLTIHTKLQSKNDVNRSQFIQMLKKQGGFRIPFFPDSPSRGSAPATTSGSARGRLLLPVTGGLASKLTNSNHPLRDFIWQHDEVLSLAHGLNVFMSHNEIRSYTSRSTTWRKRKTEVCKANRALFVDLSELKPFISQFDDDGRDQDVEPLKTLSRKGIDASTFRFWFRKICEKRLKKKGVRVQEVMEIARKKVAQRLKIEQDGDIDEHMDRLNDLHSAFHTKIFDIYPEGYAGLHPLISAAFMAKTTKLGRNATKADIIEFSVNFAMGYLEMVAQNAVSLAKSYQQLQGASHVIFSGQLVGDQTSHGQICRAFVRKYVQRLFRVEPRLTHAKHESVNARRRLQEMSQVTDLDGRVARVDVWLHHKHMRFTTWEKIQRKSRKQGVGVPGLGESIEMGDITSRRCCSNRRLRSFVFASVGTGSPIAKVTLHDHKIVDVQKIGGSAIGGGTSVGLLKAATGKTTWDDQVARPLDVTSWRIIIMVSRCVAEIVSLTSVLHEVDTVVFTGGFFHNNPDAEEAMVKVCLEFGLEVLFQKPDARGFTAAVGANHLSPGSTTFKRIKSRSV